MVFIDGVNVYSKGFKKEEGSNLCGGAGKESELIFSITVPHNSPDAVIILTTNLPEGRLKTWGVKNFRLNVDTCLTGCDTCNDATNACLSSKLVS